MWFMEVHGSLTAFVLRRPPGRVGRPDCPPGSETRRSAASARFWLSFAPKVELEKRRHLVPESHAKGHAALGVMETHLARHDWFAGRRYSIADIALYAYTHCAADGGFDLAAYPAVGCREV
jgi:glutathione S-transferase